MYSTLQKQVEDKAVVCKLLIQHYYSRPRPKRTCMVDGKKVRITEYKNLLKNKSPGSANNGSTSPAPSLSSVKSSINPNADLLSAFPGSSSFFGANSWLTRQVGEQNPAFGALTAAKSAQNGDNQQRLPLELNGIANAALLASLANHHHQQFQRNHSHQMLHSSE